MRLVFCLFVFFFGEVAFREGLYLVVLCRYKKTVVKKSEFKVFDNIFISGFEPKTFDFPIGKTTRLFQNSI